MLIRRQRTYSKLKYSLILLTVSCLILITFFSVKDFINIQPALREVKKELHSVLSSIRTCRPYTAPDNRSFYERDYPQANIPQRLSNSSYENILYQLHSLRLIVLACARNVQFDIDIYRSHIEPIIDLFHPSSSIHILESDSKDRTVEHLRKWSRVQVYPYGGLARTYPDRTDRLAYCRNILLDKAHALTPDYILVTDLDMFSANVSSFLTNFQYDTNDWSVMTATRSDSYYDIWALRSLSDSIVNYDVWHRLWDLQISLNNYCGESVYNQIIGIHTKPIPIERGLIEVRSAFSGAALYKANVTYGCKYNGARTTCEHVSFHLCIRKKYQGRIFINPAFQIV